MMATNFNDARKKQKRTTAVDNVGDSSSPASVVVVPSALSLVNILKEFPDFLFVLLPFIADRMIWNSIASSNKEMHAKSKTILPPWPLCCKLPFVVPSDYLTWSPCGERIAYECSHVNIVIFDQRLGQLRNHRNAHGRCNISYLKYSPDGKFLVSTGGDGFVRLWNNTRNYEQLQEWNMREEAVEGLSNEYAVNVSLSISPCSGYIALSVQNCVLLKDIGNKGKTIKSFVPPFTPTYTTQSIMFSPNGRAIFVCCHEIATNSICIKVWRLYLDDDDDDRFITLMKQTKDVFDQHTITYTFSHDTTMVAIHNRFVNKGTLWSIDMDHNCLQHRSDIEGITSLHFTFDNKHIVCNTDNGPKLWSIVGCKYMDNTIHVLDNGNITNLSPWVKSLSPNNQQLIIKKSRNLYITSYFVE